MYLIKRTITSNYGYFKEQTKSPLSKVPESVRRGWLVQGLIERCTLPDLTPEPSPDAEPQSYAEELGQKSARTVEDGGETYAKRGKAKRS